jgi:hypothetical protein
MRHSNESHGPLARLNHNTLEAPTSHSAAYENCRSPFTSTAASSAAAGT